MLVSSAESKRTDVIERLNESDPLFRVIPEKQLGLDFVSERPKIAKELLEGMRLYLIVANDPEKMSREKRVRKSLRGSRE